MEREHVVAIPSQGSQLSAEDEGHGWPLWLLIGGTVVLFAGTPMPITDRDTVVYGTIAKNILASGDWLTLHHHTMAMVDKPPLTIWFMSLSFLLFGISEWAIRAWHILFAVGTVLATYALARLALSPRQAILSALVLLGSVQFFYQSLVPEQDIPLTLFVTLTLYWHLRWEREGMAREAVFAWLCMALAALTKGLVGLALPVMIIGVHLVVDRPRLPSRALSATIAGALVFTLVATPWFIVGAIRQGQPFIDTFFIHGTGPGRFFHQYFNEPMTVPGWVGFGAYVPLLLLGVLPWTGWVWPALREGWAAKKNRPSALWVYTLWLIVIFAFLSVSLGDKVSRYLLPLFPPLAVLVGRALDEAKLAKSAAWVSLGGAIPLVALMIFVLVWKFPGEVGLYAPLFLSFLPAFIAALVGYSLATFSGRPRMGLILLVALTFLSYGLAMIAVDRHWDQISPWRPFARIVNKIEAPAARVLVLEPYNEFADFYIMRPKEFVSEADLAQGWRNGSVIAILPSEVMDRLPAPQPMILDRPAHGSLVLVSNFPVQPPREGSGSFVSGSGWAAGQALTTGRTRPEQP